jgi:DNA-binding transcriptional MocR family regulator
MAEGRRREILDVAARNYCAVIEDDWAGDLRFEGPDVPTMHALDGGGHVIYLSTFSKKLLPGLRVGWVTAPTPVLQRLVLLKQIEDHGTSLLVQAALHEFLRDGGLDEHLQRVRAAYRERRDTMLAALDAGLPAEVARTHPQGGLFLWLTLPGGLDGSEIFAAARERGVLLSPGELFHADGGGRNTMRLTFSAASRAQIETGIAILAELIRARMPGGASARQGASLEAVPIL